MILVLTLLAAQGLVAPSPTVAIERTGIDLLAFSDDGKSALALETTSGGLVTTKNFLLLDASGIRERLPLSQRMPGNRDGVDDDVCRQTAKRLSDLAIDLRGVTVAIGLCSQPERRVVDVMTRPLPQVLSKRVGALHALVGFAGRTFLPPTGPLVVVIGVDGMGNDRVGVTQRPVP
jgi:ABC-type amino acid transport substrate-binding protein